MTIDFPKNLGHLPEYEAVKSFVYDKLVHNTTSKVDFEIYLAQACRDWPRAATYLQELAMEKHRWGAPWRLEHFTLGYEASSPVEGSFSSFKRALGDEPKSFAGVVQEHVKKDIEKTQMERRRLVNASIRAHDSTLKSARSDAANQCAQVFSEDTTEKFELANQDAQDYVCVEIGTLSEEQIQRGVSRAHSVSRRVHVGTNPPPPRIVEEINGIKYCSCLKDKNSGRPDKHIQCVLGGAFVKEQFNPHWKVATDVEEAEVVIHPSLENAMEVDMDEKGGVNIDTMSSMGIDEELFGTINDDDDIPNDGVGVFAVPLAAATMEATVSTVRRAVPRKKKMDSTQKYRALLQESQHLANIVSQENEEVYNKTMTLLKYIKTNIQNSSGEELTMAAADYLGVKRSAAEISNVFDDKILAPVQKRSSGAISIKRKKNCVEKSVGVSSGKANCCRLCGFNHRINKCDETNKLGERLTKSTWRMIDVVPELDEPVPHCDPVVPKDALLLQIVGSKGSGESKMYKANVILFGVKPKEAPPSWLSRSTIDDWARMGDSSAHYVLIPHK